MPDRSLVAVPDRAEASYEELLHEAARGFAATFDSGLPVHELRPVLREQAARLCACVLGIDATRVSASQQLLLESLQAVTLQSIIQECVGRSLPLELLLNGLAAEQIAEFVLQPDPADQNDGGERAGIVVRPDPAGALEPFPLTDVQQAYLLGRDAAIDLGNVTSTFYAELSTIDLDIDQLEAALNGLIARHDALRTVVLTDGYQQVLAQVPEYHIAREDLRELDEDAREARLTELRTTQANNSFAPSVWPLFEVRATRLDERHTRLHLLIDLLITDATSIARLLWELSQRYGDPGRVWPGLGLSFRDYQLAVGGLVGSARFERARGYWLGRVESLPGAPELPLARSLGSVVAPRFAQRSCVLGAQEWAALRGRASRCGVTASMVLAAAYAVVLGQWSRSSRFTLNVTVNGRLPVHPQVNEVLGDFTALSLLEVDAGGGGSFVEFARGLQGRLWADLDHREFSGVRVLRELARRRGAATAAMPVVFSTRLGAGLDPDFAPDWLEGIEYTLAKAPQMLLEQLVYEFRGELVLSWDVVEEVFAPGVVDGMFAAYCGLVQRLAAGDGVWQQPVGSLAPASQQVVRARVNDTAADTPRCLLHRLGGWLSQRGPAPAVVDADRVLSYGEVDRRAVRIGRRLRELGAGPGQLVAIVADKGWPQVVAAVGVLYSGAAYLPVDASLPPARVHHLLERGQVRVVLTTSTLDARLPWPDGTVRLAVDDDRVWDAVDDTPLPDVQTTTDLAYVIFTSGSTGQPKGVMIDHQGAVNTVADINTRYHIGPHDRVLALSSLSFDLSVWDLFGTLAAGGTIVLPEPQAGKDPARWTQLIDQHHITVWNSVPALMDMLVTYLEGSRTPRPDTLRVVLLSGDWIPLGLPERIRHIANPTHLISLGGATEASIWSIHHPIGDPDPDWASIPYGTPLANQTCHILDHQLQPRPDWVTGDLYIGGTGLAHGYWRDPHRTTAAFITDPHTNTRLYRTGDLGRYHPDGTIEFLGRTDTQVKINGYRIELGEIENTLTQHPTVKDAVVTTTNNHLTAYITTQQPPPEDQPTTARAHVREWAAVFDAERATAEATRHDVDFDTTGWTSSFTGERISDAEMRDWVDRTVSRIQAFHPEDVLEIGCGTGMIGIRLARTCRSYTGTDISTQTLATLRRSVDDLGPALRATVTLVPAAADELDGIPDGCFDCVVLNSVTQYFPDGDYLRAVIVAALAKLRPDGVLFLGDVRDLRFLGAFHAAVELATCDPTDALDTLAYRVTQRSLRERELAIDPRFFGTAASGLLAVLPRGGGERTEMADYRYDVVIMPGRSQPDPLPVKVMLHWEPDRDVLAEVTGVLDRGPRVVHVAGVPNRRLSRDVAALSRLFGADGAAATAAELPALLDTPQGLRPDDFAEVAAGYGYRHEVCYPPDAPPGTFDVVITSPQVSRRRVIAALATGQRASGAAPDTTTLVNNPVAARQAARLPELLLAHAARMLPDYMVPDEVVILPELPLSTNGKVDRARLPRPDRTSRDRRSPGRAPGTPTEYQLAAIWGGLLSVERVAVDDNFFLSGGDSLTAVRLLSTARAAGLPLRPGDLFTHPTIAQLAELVADRALGGTAGDETMELPAIQADAAAALEPFPLTEIQQAYLLGRAGYFELGNTPAAFYVETEATDLDVTRLEQALRGLIARHDMLRVVVSDDGTQRVLPEVPDYSIDVTDCTDLDAQRTEQRLAEIRTAMTGQVFDPGIWPLFEVHATRLDERHARLHLAVDLMIVDGVSVNLILSELSQRYGDPGRVWPGLGLSFRDYQLAVGGLVGSARFERARGYWLGRVESLPGAPELPLARSLGSVVAPRFAQRSCVLGAQEWAALRGRASRCGVTASMVLAAAYAVVLGQWSRSSRFTLNVTVNGRLPVHPQVNEVLGDFTALSLLEVDAGGGGSFVEFARGLQGRLWADLDHREFSGVRVLRELARRRGAATAAMPVVFTSSVDAGVALQTGALGEFVEAVVHTPQVYLDHQAFQLDNTLVLSWDVVEEVFAPGVVDGMFAAYCGLVQRLAAGDGVWQQPVGSLAPASQQVVRARVNDTAADTPRCLLHRLGGWLSQRGPAPAVVDADRVLSYGEVDRRAVRIGRRLRELGAGPGQLVAIVADKGWPQVVAAVGVLYSGAAYLPVDASLPPARVHHLLERGQVRVVLTTSTLDARLPWPDGTVRLAVDDDRVWDAVDDTPLPDVQTTTDLAYVIFTSGSTGQPKGVMIDHQGAVNTVADINTRYHIGPHDRVLALSSLSFDLSVWDLFGTLAAGGTIVLPEPQAGKDPARWTQLIDQHHITVWNSVPALMDMLVTYLEGSRTPRPDTLRVVLLSGDWIPLGLPERIRHIANPTHLISLGGATEASIWSIHHPIGDPDPDWASIPYGTPLANQTCHILDHQLQPRPDWVTGDLYIGGTGLAHGYWRDPHRTTAAFITDPHTNTRLYRTGDLGRYHPDGTIEFLGRTDTQVKINGYRIELGEIENTLTQHPTVKDAVVTTTNNHLTAYITTQQPPPEDQPTTAEDLLELCRRQLPAWMVPGRVVALDELPLNGNGKVDRSALADLQEPAPRTDAIVAPRTDAERVLHDIWCDLLGRESVSVLDTFAAVGGDSLLGLQVVHRAAARGLVFSPRDFFAHPTIADLATQVASTPASTSAGSSDISVTGPVPLTPRQAAFLARYPDPPAHWHYTLLFELAEHLDRTALRVALRAVLRHHDGLRISFHRGRAWQARIAAAAGYPLPISWTDLGGLPDSQRAQAIRLACTELTSSITLDGPLLRVAYFHNGPGGGDRLFVVGHWLLWDNYSCRVFLEDLLNAHDQVIADGEVSLPKATSFAEWTGQLTDLAGSSGVAAEREHWRALLHRSPAALPVDRDADNLSGDERVVVAALGAQATARLSELTTGDTTIGDLLLAATACALARWAGTDIIRVDVDTHGRSRTDTDTDASRTIGRLSARWPLDLTVAAMPDLAHAAKAVATARLAVAQHGANFDLLAFLDGTQELRGIHAEVLFNYLGRVDSLVPPQRMRLADEDAGPAHAADVPREHLLEFLSGSVDGDTVLACQYSAACHDEQTIRTLVRAVFDDVRAALGVPVQAGGWAVPPAALSFAAAMNGARPASSQGVAR